MASLFELRLPEFGIERMGGGAIIAVRGLAAMEGVELERLGGAIMASRGSSTSVIFWGLGVHICVGKYPALARFVIVCFHLRGCVLEINLLCIRVENRCKFPAKPAGLGVK